MFRVLNQDMLLALSLKKKDDVKEYRIENFSRSGDGKDILLSMRLVDPGGIAVKTTAISTTLRASTTQYQVAAHRTPDFGKWLDERYDELVEWLAGKAHCDLLLEACADPASASEIEKHRNLLKWIKLDAVRTLAKSGEDGFSQKLRDNLKEDKELWMAKSPTSSAKLGEVKPIPILLAPTFRLPGLLHELRRARSEAQSRRAYLPEREPRFEPYLARAMERYWIEALNHDQVRVAAEVDHSNNGHPLVMCKIESVSETIVPRAGVLLRSVPLWKDRKSVV